MSECLFPVIHSLPSGEALIEKVLPEYPISKPYRCCLHKRGLNDTYRVETDAEPYILRIYRSCWRSKAEIDFELELLTFLHQQRLPVAYPIATKQGSFTEVIIAPEGKRYIALFSYAPGRAVNEKLEPEESRKLGMALAQIHQTTDDFNSHLSR
ncbi:MAG TPA: phosphotransferase, partial [Coleofasciculaceae cyanobacterium]